MRAKVSVRSNNFISERIKVNDLRGNPIEMAAQVVWRVVDTAQALFDVDDYKAFVAVQVEAGIRAIGSRYPYDDFEHLEVTLRGNHDQVGDELRAELPPGQPYLLTRGPLPEPGFVYVAIPPDRAEAFQALPPLQEVVLRVTIRAPRTRYLATPVAELASVVSGMEGK